MTTQKGFCSHSTSTRFIVVGVAVVVVVVVVGVAVVVFVIVVVVAAFSQLEKTIGTFAIVLFNKSLLCFKCSLFFKT